MGRSQVVNPTRAVVAGGLEVGSPGTAGHLRHLQHSAAGSGPHRPSTCPGCRGCPRPGCPGCSGLSGAGQREGWKTCPSCRMHTLHRCTAGQMRQRLALSTPGSALSAACCLRPAAGGLPSASSIASIGSVHAIARLPAARFIPTHKVNRDRTPQADEADSISRGQWAMPMGPTLHRLVVLVGHRLSQCHHTLPPDSHGYSAPWRSGQLTHRVPSRVPNPSSGPGTWCCG